MAAVAETVGGKRKASDSAEEAAGVPKRIKVCLLFLIWLACASTGYGWTMAGI